MGTIFNPEERTQGHVHKSRGPESQIRLIEEEFLACSLRTARNMCEVFNKYSNIHLGAPNCPFYLTPGSGNTSCFGREEK